MSYTVTRYSDATALLAAAEPFLLQHEALNGLLLSAARTQQRAAPRRRRRPLYVTVTGPAGPTLVALTSAGQRLLLADNHASSDKALDALVAALRDEPRALTTVFAEETLARRFVSRYATAIGQQTTLVERQQLLELTAVALPPRLPQGRLRAATIRESDLLADWLTAFQDETAGHAGGDDSGDDRHAVDIIVDGLIARKDVYVWDVGSGTRSRPVAMAARARPTARGIALSLVYTPPEERRRGYATACVAHLSHLLLDDAWAFCTLLADPARVSTETFLGRIGYRPVADFAAYRFDPPLAEVAQGR